MSESASADVHNTKAKWEWLEPLCLHGGVNLAFENVEDASWPVLLDDIERDRSLIVDISAVPALATRLERGDAFHLVGHVNGAMVRTSPLAVLERLDDPQRMRLRCTYPAFLSTIHRRGTFRAPISPEMGVVVRLALNPTASITMAEIRNLSLGGCLLAMRLADAVALEPGQRFEALVLRFPNGQQLTLEGWIRHVRTDETWTMAMIGCEFARLSIDSERLLWHCVKEIEREGVRKASISDKPLEPSGLFLSPNGRRPAPARAVAADATAIAGNVTAHRLLKIADYLKAQIVQLQNGGMIAPSLLSRHTDTLLTLGMQSREALLYALGYLEAQPALVKHALTVAVRTADLARWQGYDSDVLKAITASALIHDLGKALLPASLIASRGPLTVEQRELLSTHVVGIRERSVECRWLSSSIAEQVIEQVNERLDGGGYPSGLEGEAVGDIGRLMAVVDVIDALTQPRADRGAWSLVEAYRHVLSAPTQFDNTWAQRYVRRFGTTPVGSLVRYSSGALAWVQRLDAQGRPAQVHMVLNANSRQRRLDQVLTRQDLDQLGRLEGVVEPAEFGLALGTA